MSLEFHNQVLEEFKRVTTPPINPLFLPGFAIEQVGFNLGISEEAVRRVIYDAFDTFIMVHGEEYLTALTDEKIMAQIELQHAQNAFRNISRAMEHDDGYVPPPPDPEYVYLFRAGVKPYLYKIGKSKNPTSRVKALNRSLPPGVPETEIVHTISCDDFRGAEEFEKILHKEYDEQRHRGEWFDLSPEDVERIRSIVSYQDGRTTLTFE